LYTRSDDPIHIFKIKVVLYKYGCILLNYIKQNFSRNIVYLSLVIL